MVLHALWCWIREKEHRQLCGEPDSFLGYQENTPFLFFHNNGTGPSVSCSGFLYNLNYKIPDEDINSYHLI